jgi:hypothetical protein
MRGDTAGAGHEQDCWRAREAGWGPRGRQARAGARASWGGWVDRPSHRLVRPLGPGNGAMDPSP